MLTELNGKCGTFCGPALRGELRCPLNVRATSEDVVTGHLWGTLSVIDPRWWLPDLLNRGLGDDRFRRRLFRRFRIDVWERQRRPSNLPWREGATEVDVVPRWENPPTTAFVEMKLGSPVARATARNDGSHFPADQVARNLRVGLDECGRLPSGRLLAAPRRNFALLLLTPHGDPAAVAPYRTPDQIRSALPPSLGEPDLPSCPFVGTLSYADVADALAVNRRLLSRPERVLADRLGEYLRTTTNRCPRPAGVGGLRDDAGAGANSKPNPKRGERGKRTRRG